MAGGLPSKQIIVDVLTPSYRIVGKVQITHTGVIGVLNDKRVSIMDMREASIARLVNPTKLVDRFKTIRVVKDQIFAVCLSRREDVGSDAYSRGGYGLQYEYPVRILSPTFELDGVFEWSERFDLHAIMVEGTRDFMPFYEVNLRTVMTDKFRMDSPASIVNRSHMDALALKQPPAEAGSE